MGLHYYSAFSLRLQLKPAHKHIVVLLAYSALLLCSEWLYRYFFNIPIATKPLESFGFILLIVGLFYFARYRITQIFIFGFFALSIIGNNVHYYIYHSWLNGINYYLMLKEWREVTTAGTPMLPQLMPAILWGVAECALFLSLTKFRKRTALPVADALCAALFLFVFVRSFSTTQELGIFPKSSYGRIKANYFSFGYFVGHVIPYQLFSLSNIPDYSHPKPEKIAEPVINNIIFLLGESASSMHVSHFGYPRKTTPFLDEFVDSDFQPIVRSSYSAGFMTAVSLPTFFNAVPYPNGLQHINSGNTNLFRLAKEQGYQTYFHSAQAENEMAIMNLIGSKWIDKQTFPTTQGYSRNESMPDDLLLTSFEHIDLKQGKNFVILHQRGSHTPYGQLLKSSEHVFGRSQLDQYDNTMFKTDQIIKSLFDQLQKLGKNDWMLIYTSDHGQTVNDQVANQGTRDPDSYTVPLMIYTPNTTLQAEARKIFNACEHPFHQQLATFLIHSLGYNMPVSSCEEGYVTGNLITGDSGYLKINHTGETRYVYPGDQAQKNTGNDD